MKKLLAIFLALAFICTGTLAFAEDMTAELEKVTLIVKETLGISDDYANYRGDKSGDSWYLTWDDGQRELSVTCSAEGKIYSYYVYDNGSYRPYTDDFRPMFPNSAPDQLLETANAFLERVITDDEGWLISETGAIGLNNGAGTYTVSGCITRGDYPTDIYIDITIDMDTNEVTGFYRGDSYMDYSDRMGSDEINISEDDAKKLLLDKMSLEKRYYIVKSGDMARLVYVPAFEGTYLVRAIDGELIDLDDVYSQVYASAGGDGGMEYMAEDAAAQPRELTDAEKQGISVYKDAMSVDALDMALRAMTELGITDEYKLVSADYSTGDGNMTAELSYNRPLPDAEVMERFGYSEERVEELRAQGTTWNDSKYARLDAYTGSVEYFSTYRPYGNLARESAADETEYQDAADAVIKKYMSDIADQLELAEGSAANGPYAAYSTEVYNYVRVYDGYRFYDNYVRVTVNAEDGTIDAIDRYWDDAQEFEAVDPESVITAEAALEKYLSAMEFEAAYISIPASMNDYEITHDMTLCWRYVDKTGAYGVDAVTGEVLSDKNNTAEAKVYDDIAGIAQEEMILKLADYSVGFAGGSFLPDKEFTIRDMLTIMLSMNGNYDTETWEFEDMAASAKALGAGDFSGADPEAQVTRSEFARALITAAGYGDAAAINGIFSCGFADEADIPAEDMGAVAIAYGLGIISAGDDGMIRAGEVLTRAQAAEIAYNFLSVEK
jgi:hypothetical protein